MRLARELLHHKKFLDGATKSLVWLDWFDAAMWEYYSKFRSMVAFFMEADGKQHRMTFINTMFRRQGDVRSCCRRPISTPHGCDTCKRCGRNLTIRTCHLPKSVPRTLRKS